MLLGRHQTQRPALTSKVTQGTPSTKVTSPSANDLQGQASHIFDIHVTMQQGMSKSGANDKAKLHPGARGCLIKDESSADSLPRQNPFMALGLLSIVLRLISHNEAYLLVDVDIARLRLCKIRRPLAPKQEPRPPGGYLGFSDALPLAPVGRIYEVLQHSHSLYALCLGQVLRYQAHIKAVLLALQLYWPLELQPVSLIHLHAHNAVCEKSMSAQIELVCLPSSTLQPLLLTHLHTP